MSSSDDVGGGSWQVSPETRRALRLSTARGALRRHDFKRAVVEVEELLDETPDDREALGLLAACTMELRDFEVALEAWRSLVAVDPKSTSAWTQLGVAAFETVAFEEAAGAARSALALHDDLPDAWFLAGLCAERLDDDERAWAAFERAHRRSPLGCPLPLPLSDDDVRDLVREALAELPKPVANLWSKVPLRVERLPDRAELTASVPPISPRVLALFEGTAPAVPSARLRPTALRVYRVNLAHHETRDHALDALIDALEQEATDWLPERR